MFNYIKHTSNLTNNNQFKISLYFILVVTIVLNSIQSVSIVSIPLTWIGMTIITMSLFTFSWHLKKYELLVIGLLFVILATSLLMNISNWSDFEKNIPNGSTTPYLIYVFLRYIHYLAFLAIVLTVLKLCARGYLRKIIDFICLIGVVVAIYALYVYIAHQMHLPEILPRSRMGTSGGEQIISFTYGFHRALGSFREPSHLAEWLMLPLVLSFYKTNNRFKWQSATIAITMLLTGSLTGILSIIIGLFASIVVMNFRFISLKNTLKSFKYLFYGVILLSTMVIVLNYIFSGLFFDTLSDRIALILIDGIRASNRGYIYQYIDQLDKFPLWGLGLGNIQIDLANHNNNDLISSVLSLYINMYYSFGAPIFVVAITLLLLPIYLLLQKGKLNTEKDDKLLKHLVLWGYISWLVAFSVHSEELQLMFGLSFGLLLHLTIKNLCYLIKKNENE